ncbi:hypothetical protein ACU686_37340 [Yinghuangia aomiensis]
MGRYGLGPHRPALRSPGHVRPLPVVDLNRAVAVSMAQGPAAALPLVDALVERDALPNSHLLPGVRGELLTRLARVDEARAELERAVLLCGNTRERSVLQRKIAALTDADDKPDPDSGES